MATFTLRHFSNAESLQAVQPRYLTELLDRYAPYFAERGVDFGSLNGDGLNYEAIAGVLITPDEQTPKALLDDLYFVNEMATPESMDALLESAETGGITLDVGEEPTPADVAVQLRLRRPELLEQKHAEQHLLHSRRTFEYFQSPDDVPRSFSTLSTKAVRTFEEHLGVRLEAMKRGRACKLFVFEREDGVWFLVRRGEPFKREGALEKAKPTAVFYRPAKYDVLKYDETLGELSINAQGTKKLVEFYQALMGELLFADDQRFQKVAKYTLEPLQKLGRASLVCSDVEDLDSVTLKEVQIFWGGAEGEVETRRARDLFAALEARERTLPDGPIIKASFTVKFADAKTPRTVTVRRGNVASYTRDPDAGVVEVWLRKRGFVKTTTAPRPGVRHAAAHAAPSVAVA